MVGILTFVSEWSPDPNPSEANMTGPNPSGVVSPVTPEPVATEPAGNAPGLVRAVPVPAPALDLDSIERDLADVERALERLDSGEYWTDEVTGAPLDDETLEAAPVTRTNLSR